MPRKARVFSKPSSRYDIISQLFSLGFKCATSLITINNVVFYWPKFPISHLNSRELLNVSSQFYL